MRALPRKLLSCIYDTVTQARCDSAVCVLCLLQGTPPGQGEVTPDAHIPHRQHEAENDSIGFNDRMILQSLRCTLPPHFF